MNLHRQRNPWRHSLSRICVTGAVKCRLAILRPTASTAAASSAETCAKMVVASMCTVGIITATRVCVNIPLMKTVNTAPNINAANLTATTVDGPDPNTAHTISDQQGRDSIPAFYELRHNCSPLYWTIKMINFFL